MSEKVKTWTVTGLGTGKPDYSGVIHSGRTIFGYEPNPNVQETYAWPMRIFVAPDKTVGPAVYTRGPLAPGEEAVLVNPTTGLEYVHCNAGEDWVFKALFISLSQPVRFIMTLDSQAPDISCQFYLHAFAKPANPIMIGCYRTLFEPLNAPGNARFYVRNEGVEPAYGKAWAQLYIKTGGYTWS